MIFYLPPLGRFVRNTLKIENCHRHNQTSSQLTDHLNFGTKSRARPPAPAQEDRGQGAVRGGHKISRSYFPIITCLAFIRTTFNTNHIQGVKRSELAEVLWGQRGHHVICFKNRFHYEPNHKTAENQVSKKNLHILVEFVCPKINAQTLSNL